MAYFAQINDTNVVTQVIAVGDADAPTEQAGLDFIKSIGLEGKWLQTSYNTRGGINIRDNGVPLRKNYAGIGYIYDPVRDAFYTQQPWPSWSLNDDTCIWEPPTPYPIDGKTYTWDEPTLSWKEIGA